MLLKIGKSNWNLETEPCAFGANATAQRDGFTEHWQGKNSAVQDFKSDTLQA